jgi:hypothetical protein
LLHLGDDVRGVALALAYPALLLLPRPTAGLTQ